MSLLKTFFTQLEIITVYSLHVFQTMKYVKVNRNHVLEIHRHNYNTWSQRFVEIQRLELFKIKSKTSYKGNRFLTITFIMSLLSDRLSAGGKMLFSNVVQNVSRKKMET